MLSTGKELIYTLPDRPLFTFTINGKEYGSNDRNSVEVEGQKLEITWSEMDIKQSEDRLHRIRFPKPQKIIEVHRVRKASDKGTDQKTE
jgi:hypothetical protein